MHKTVFVSVFLLLVLLSPKILATSHEFELVKDDQEETDQKRLLLIKIKTLDGKEFPLFVNDRDTLHDVRENLNATLNREDSQENFNFSKVQLIFNGHILDNNKMLKDYDIQDKDTIHALQKEENHYGTLERNSDVRLDPVTNEFLYRDIYTLNIFGMKYIAERYNAKYFSKSRNDRKIVATSGTEDFFDTFDAFLKDDSLIILGVTVPISHNPDDHPITLILQKNLNDLGHIDFFLMDGTGRFELNFKKKIQTNERFEQYKDRIIFYQQVFARQISTGHCKTEALVFLKNALLLDDIKKYMTIVDVEQLKNGLHEGIFGGAHPPVQENLKEALNNSTQDFSNTFFMIYKGPLLKTVQSRKVIKACNVGLNDILPNTGVGEGKQPHTFGEFQSTYEKPMPYKNLRTKAERTLPERSYLHEKTKQHQRILEKAEIKNRSH